MSNETVVQIDSARKKHQRNDRCSRSVNAREHFWSITGKNLSSSEKGTLFFEQMMKESEIKVVDFLESQHEKPAGNMSQTEEMPFIKLTGHSKKCTKIFYKSSSSSKKSKKRNNMKLIISYSKSCKSKGRPSKSH